MSGDEGTEDNTKTKILLRHSSAKTKLKQAFYWFTQHVTVQVLGDKQEAYFEISLMWPITRLMADLRQCVSLCVTAVVAFLGGHFHFDFTVIYS